MKAPRYGERMPPAARLVALALFVGAAFAVGAVVVPRSVGELRATVDGAGVWAPVVFALCWIALTPALAPGTLLATAAGLAFGVGLGVTVGLVGATAGGILAFLIARGTAATAVAHLEGERLRRLQERVERRGFLAVAAARAAPGVPATLLNYACGLSRVRLRDFAAGTLVGGAPRIFGYAALGGSGGDVTSPLAVVGLAIMAALSIGGVVVVARRKLVGARPI